MEVNGLRPIYISLFISVTCIIIQCPAKNGLQVTQNTKYICRCWWQCGPTSTRCPVDADSMLAQRLRRWPTTEPAPTKHPCLTGKAAQFYIIVHTEVGPSNDHQLSVDDLINMFTYFNDYMSILLITIITLIISTLVINAWYLSHEFNKKWYLMWKNKPSSTPFNKIFSWKKHM